MSIKSCLCKIDDAYFINLNNNLDRLYNINSQADFPIHRFEATPASNFNDMPNLSLTEQACFDSHYKLWQTSLTYNQSLLIVEDDAVFHPHFKDLWEYKYCKLMPQNYSLIYLGGCLNVNQKHYHKVIHKYNQHFYTIKKNNFFKKSSHYWHMTSICYIISPKGAKVLIDSRKAYGTNMPVDHFMIEHLSEVDTPPLYHSFPQLVAQSGLESSIK